MGKLFTKIAILSFFIFSVVFFKKIDLSVEVTLKTQHCSSVFSPTYAHQKMLTLEDEREHLNEMVLFFLWDSSQILH